MLRNIAIASNNFVELSECFVILDYKLIIAQGKTIIVQDKRNRKNIVSLHTKVFICVVNSAS